MPVNGTIHIRSLNKDDIHCVAVIAAAAYCRDGSAALLPLLRVQNAGALNGLRAAFEVRLAAYQLAGHPIRCAFDGSRLAGVAVYHNGEKRLPVLSWADQILQRLPRLAGLLPCVHWRRFPEMARLIKAPVTAAAPYLFLETLAVVPGYQGQGIRAALLEDGMDQAAAADLRGMYLYTGDQPKASFYRERGFRTLEVRGAGAAAIYHMYRFTG